MSLKMFHVVFILAAILLCDFLAFWALQLYSKLQINSLLWMSGAAFASSVILIVYLLWFLRKSAAVKK